MNTGIKNETLDRLINDFKIEELKLSEEINALAEADHRYLKDLRINLSNVMAYANLTQKERYLLGLAVAVNEKNEVLKAAFEALLEQENVSKAELNELYAITSLMNINNVFYRFRHFTHNDYYNNTPAGIKMSIMMNPVLGKEFFELLSLAISAVNACEMCVKAHEASVKSHGGTEQRIYDAIRLAAVVKGFSVII